MNCPHSIQISVQHHVWRVNSTHKFVVGCDDFWLYLWTATMSFPYFLFLSCGMVREKNDKILCNFFSNCFFMTMYPRAFFLGMLSLSSWAWPHCMRKTAGSSWTQSHTTSKIWFPNGGGACWANTAWDWFCFWYLPGFHRH
jgi:hypothetical protein